MAFLGTAYVSPSAAHTASFNSGDITLDSDADELLLAVNISAPPTGTSPTLVVSVDLKGIDGVYYNAFTSAILTAAGNTVAHMGPALPVNIELTPVVRVSFVIGGTTPSFSFSATLEQNARN